MNAFKPCNHSVLQRYKAAIFMVHASAKRLLPNRYGVERTGFAFLYDSIKHSANLGYEKAICQGFTGLSRKPM